MSRSAAAAVTTHTDDAQCGCVCVCARLLLAPGFDLSASLISHANDLKCTSFFLSSAIPHLVQLQSKPERGLSVRVFEEAAAMPRTQPHDYH